MLHPDLDAELRAAPPGERRTVIVRVDVDAQTAEESVRALTSRGERMRALTALHASAKAPVLATLRADPELELEELPSSPDTLVTASAKKLAALLGPGTPLRESPDVLVLPNAQHYTAR